MKTIIAVTFFGILTYAFAAKLKYGESVCQNDVGGMVNLDPKKFFSGTWYLTHSTPSSRVTKSTICRDYPPIRKEDGTINVTYKYYENGASGNRYVVTCTGTQSTTRADIFDFNCNSNNERGETTPFKIDLSVIATDYDTYCVMYRCVTVGTHTEDNVFLIFREKNPSEDKVKELTDRYGLTGLISRKEATCTN